MHSSSPRAALACICALSVTAALSALAAGCQRPNQPANAPSGTPEQTTVEISEPPQVSGQPAESEHAGEPPPPARDVEPGIATNSSAPTRGTLPTAELNRTLSAATPALRDCYERALELRPSLRGHLRIEFVIAPDGSVPHAEAVEVADALPDAAVADCVVGEIRKLTFAQPKGGRVFVAYPLAFEPPPAASPPAGAVPAP